MPALLGCGLIIAARATGLSAELPDADRLLIDFTEPIGAWAYAVVGGFAFLETGAFVGLIAPGEMTVVLGGVLAARGTLEPIPLVAVVWVSAAVGDSTSFLLGRRLGRAFLLRHGGRVRVTPERLDRVDRFVARHGAKTVVLGRFIGLVRALAPFVAGASGLGYRRFLTASLIGTAAWAAAFVTLGYAFSRSFSDINDALSTGRTGLSALLAAVLAVSALRRRGQARRLEARRASDGSG